MSKPRLVFLFAGQLRTFDSLPVVRSWRKFFDAYDVLVYGCFWSNRGKSACSISSGIATDVNPDEVISLDCVKDVFQTNNIWLYDYEDFLSGLPTEYAQFQSCQYFGCSVPHSFLRKQVCDKMIEDGKDISFDPMSYTLIRPDLIWLTEPPQCFTDHGNFLWHNDSPQAYHPNRIYDIFMCSNRQNVLKMGNMYEDVSGFLTAVDSTFNCSLHPLDSCRLNYNYSVLNGIEVRSQQRLHIDVLREDSDVDRYREVYTKHPLWGVA